MIGWKPPTHEPTLDELLADEMMTSVMRSAGLDRSGFERTLADAARRLAQRGAPEGACCCAA